MDKQSTSDKESVLLNPVGPLDVKGELPSDVRPPALVVSAGGTFDVAPRMAPVGREKRLAQLLMAMELDGESLSSLSEVFASYVSNPDRQRCSRLTITIDPQLPALLSNTLETQGFKSAAELSTPEPGRERVFDYTKPTYYPETVEALSLVYENALNCCLRLQHSNAAGKSSMTPNAKSGLRSAYLHFVVEYLTLGMLRAPSVTASDAEGEKKRIESIIEVLRRNRECYDRIAEVEKLLAFNRTLSADSADKYSSEKVLEMVEELHKLRATVEKIESHLAETLTEMYRLRVRNHPESFFRTEDYTVRSATLATPLAQDSALAATHDGRNPMRALANFGSMCVDGLISIRLVYHGDHDLNDLLVPLPPKTTNLSASGKVDPIMAEQQEKVDEQTRQEEDIRRYDTWSLAQRLFRKRMETVAHYRDLLAKHRPVKSDDGDDNDKHNQADPRNLTVARPLETRVAAPTTFIHFWIHESEVSDFFHQILQMRAEHYVMYQQSLKQFKEPNRVSAD